MKALNLALFLACFGFVLVWRGFEGLIPIVLTTIGGVCLGAGVTLGLLGL